MMEGSSSLAALHTGQVSGSLIDKFATALTPVGTTDKVFSPSSEPQDVGSVMTVGIAALDAFLQANVTGPVIPSQDASKVWHRISKAWTSRWNIRPTGDTTDQLRKACLKYLEIDGVAPYAYMPYPELFCIAKYIFITVLGQEKKDTYNLDMGNGQSIRHSLAWLQLRVDVWHYKLLTQPSLGSGSNFTRSSQWSEVPTLATRICKVTEAARKIIMGDEVWATEDTWSTDDKVQFLLEVSNNYILLGRGEQAKEILAEATRANGFEYALSGALGKRTKFQQNSTSQLVVLAQSRDSTTDGLLRNENDEDEDEDAIMKPDALKLNDDTLLEDIHFTKEQDQHENGTKTEPLPASLSTLLPDSQPQLSALDQIILLTEATLRDAFSPSDDLTSEEILPYAVRVISDKSTNWQIYTQALLVRSRIELHRSRTVERGVLQLQAVADQVLTDMSSDDQQSYTGPEEEKTNGNGSDELPSIAVTTPAQNSSSIPTEKTTSFLPAAKASESAPAHIRLRYVHALSSPPRWHLESELAYAWAGVGSLSSALEIFKRLRLWAEVALCLASAAASEDEQGRGAGGEEKAKGIIRWRLFHRTGTDGSKSSNPDDEQIDDVTRLRSPDFSGPERSPPPPNAPRLWCILGDLEENPNHYTRAWNISQGRYARAQKSLGEHYLKDKNLTAARDAYRLATSANRLSPEMWSRLGDISLRLANFEEAAESYSRSIGSASDVVGGEDARTWSNLGSSLWSLYREVVAAGTPKEEERPKPVLVEDEEYALETDENKPSRDPKKLLARALAAYKKGASIAHDNWRIWDNVLTLCTRIHPTPVPDIVLALKNIISIRKTEDAIDADILNALLRDQVLSKEKTAVKTESGVYEPPRGSMERLIARLMEEEVVPLITHRADLWSLTSRLRAWRNDHAGAIEAAESSWRCAVGVSSSGSASLMPNSNSDSRDGSADWTVDAAAWEDVVRKTDELASMLENWGAGVEGIGSKWKGRTRSAVRTVMGRGRETWEGSEGWKTLEGIMEGLKWTKA